MKKNNDKKSVLRCIWCGTDPEYKKYHDEGGEFLHMMIENCLKC